MNEHEKIVTIHIDEYLDYKKTIEQLAKEMEVLKKQINKLKKNQKKWYHLF
jgi:cell division protein FtsB